MATFYGNEVTRQRAGRNLGALDWGGKARIIRWSFTTPSGGNSNGDIWVLGRLRAGERILSGVEQHGVNASATLSFGTYAVLADGSLGAAIDNDCVGVTAAFAAAGLTALPITASTTVVAYQAGASDEFIGALVGGAALQNSAALSGFLIVVGD